MAKSNLAYKETEFSYMVMPETERNSNLRIRSVKTQNKVENEKTVRKTKSKAKLHKKTNLSLFFLAVIAFLVLSRGVMITEKIDRIEEKREALNKMIASNQKTQIEIDSALNLKNVEEIATQRLNMARPEKHQTVYIKIDQKDSVEKTESPDAVDAVSNFFGTLKAYLD